MNPTEVVYDYVEEIDPNLTCSICQSALVDPVTTTSCKHTFCRDCITTALQHNPQCPIDRSALTLHSLRDTEQLVKLMLDELRVRCAAEGCEEVMQRGLLLAHSRSCLKGLVKCDDPECGLSMARQRLPHHRAYECFQRKMECGKCNVILSFKARAKHTAHDQGDDRGGNEPCEMSGETMGIDSRLHGWSCPQARVPCTHAARGCPAVVTRATLSDHTQSCAFDALSSFFAVNDARFAAVEERSKTLAQIVDTLKVELGFVKTELDYARHSIEYLRKMIRDGFVGGLSSLPTSDDSADSVDDHVPNQALSIPVIDHDSNTPIVVPSTLPDVSTPRQDPPALANLDPEPHRASPQRATTGTSPSSDPAFPAWGGITHRAAADIQARERPLIPAADVLGAPPVRRRRTFADQVFDRLPAGMPVDQAVRRLMRVSAQLAEGMDSMERRNEIRSMTDGLRVSEEVASLRAIVNTMRIQVMMNHRSNSYRSMPIPSQPVSARSAPDGPLVETMTSQTTASPRTPPSSAPFSAYSAPGFYFPDRSPDTQPILLDPDEDETDPPRHGVRESVMFRARRLSMGSTSSLVSTGAGRMVGRPMGIPPPEREIGREGALAGRGSLRMRTNPISLLGRRLTQRENGPRL